MDKNTSGNTTKRTIRELPKLSRRVLPQPKDGEEEHQNPSSGLVGRIMEKGFSSSSSTDTKPPMGPSSFPRPTVLPFPVARHRSHGPHWGPITDKMDGDDNDEENVDKDDTDFDPVSDFANPVERKQKKGLDFSNWREVITQDSSIVTESGKPIARELLKRKGPDAHIENEENKDKHGKAMPKTDAFGVRELPPRLLENDGRDNAVMDDLVDRVVVSSDVVADKEMDESYSVPVQGDLVSRVVESSNVVADKEMNESYSVPVQENIKRERTVFQDATRIGLKNVQGPPSLESEIDAENRARLQEMSVNEIAEAQAELMEKMKPGLVEMLKKRGQKKSVKIKSVSSDLKVDPEVRIPSDENKMDQDPKSDSLPQESRTPHASALEPSGVACHVTDDGSMKNTGTPSKTLWNAWSERVEAARALRFALDGTVLESNSANIPNSSNVSVNGQHNIDNVTERDYLRTEGDPGATGYTIKEAVSLSRSTVPGQRALALQLLISVFDKALYGLKQGQISWNMRNTSKEGKFVDWEAVWAYALGPEPELALSLRMSLDDNHVSVVLASIRAIHTILCSEMVENFFDISERSVIYEKGMYTSPIFRSRPGIQSGFLHGGFWKYNTKPSNIILAGNKTVDTEDEGQPTIQDDIFVAGQDFAAGLTRMGILPRICYLLETDTSAALEEYLISVLVGLARHSPTCAYAIIRCPSLVQTIVDRFIVKETQEIHPSKIKSITLLKVLAQSDKKNCTHFVENGTFRVMMWHLYQHPMSPEQWIKSGREYCVLMTALLVEQLRLWKVCVQYGYCISCFPDFFPFLCLWLDPPNIDNLIESNVFSEFTSVTREAYHVLDALANRLPNLHSEEQLKRQRIGSTDQNIEAWSWSHVSPMVEMALKWISLKSNPHLSKFIDSHESTKTDFVQKSSISCFLWVISSVMHMLSSIVKKVVPEGGNILHESSLWIPWLPEFVPKIGLQIVRSRFLNFSALDNSVADGGSFAVILGDLQLLKNYELSLSSVTLLHGLVELIDSLDKSIQLAKRESYTPSSEETSFSRDGKILEDGIFTWSQDELRSLLVTFMTSVLSGWRNVQSIDKFGRGGPAPGVGVGWGVSGGGFWSMAVLLEQTEAQFVMKLHEIIPVVFEKDEPTVEDMTFTLQRIISVLGLSLTLGPRDTVIMEKAFDFLLQSTVLKYLDICIQQFLPSRGIKTFGWKYREEEFQCFSKILKSHFLNRWLSVKRKSKVLDSTPDSDHTMLKESSSALETIHEDLDTSDVTAHDAHCTSLTIEWAHQRLPLPIHWFLSPISSGPTGAGCAVPHGSGIKNCLTSPSDEPVEIAKSGLFFLLGLEAISSVSYTAAQSSPVHSVPLVWKLHSLSIVLLVGMDVLQEEKSRDTYRALQDLYGQLLDESRYSRNIKFCSDKNENLQENGIERGVELLKFQSDVHESYCTFIETLVEHFGADSYSDVIYGRQVAMYLHHSVETPVRLAMWNALSNAQILAILPPLGNCFAEAQGYLGVETNEGILEAYAKSWVSGSLDKAASRASMSFTLALHHLSFLIFVDNSKEKSVLRNKLVKSLLRDYSRKQQHEGMMLDLIHYNEGTTSEKHAQEESLVWATEKERRFRLLTEACEGNSTLLATVEKLKLSTNV